MLEVFNLEVGNRKKNELFLSEFKNGFLLKFFLLFLKIEMFMIFLERELEDLVDAKENRDLEGTVDRLLMQGHEKDMRLNYLRKKVKNDIHQTNLILF